MDKVNLLDKIREVMQPMTNISGLDINSFKYRTVKDQIDDSFGWFIDMQLERDLITQDHLSQCLCKTGYRVEYPERNHYGAGIV